MKENNLKTLKDFEPECTCGDCVCLTKNEIKAEAVKWVKSKEIHKTSGQISFIKFFNLTESDLEDLE